MGSAFSTVFAGSNHFGIAGYYALQAVRAGLIGFAFTNTSPLAVPTRGKSVNSWLHLRQSYLVMKDDCYSLLWGPTPSV